MEKTIKVIVKKPGQLHSEVRVIPNELEYLQNLVGGYIETILTRRFPGIVVLCNEDGRLKNMKLNISIGGIPIVGPVVMVSITREDFASIPEDRIKEVQQWLKRVNCSGRD